jgi:hypothetical protein
MRATEIILKNQQLPEMVASLGGKAYELTVLQVVNRALKNFENQANFVQSDVNDTAGFSNIGVDLELEVNGKEFAVEIKQNRNAQMGGTSIIYDVAKDYAALANPEAVEEEIQNLYITVIKSKKEEFSKFIKFLRSQEPTELHTKLPDRIPFSTVTKDAWNSAVSQGLLKNLNDVLSFDDTDIISNHYNKKGVYYIQIGDAGLFYMNQNPLKLPIPKFQGSIQIECRLGRSGSRLAKIQDQEYSVVNSGYRVQGRLLTNISSPYSLDVLEQATEIIQHILDHGK